MMLWVSGGQLRSHRKRLQPVMIVGASCLSLERWWIVQWTNPRDKSFVNFPLRAGLATRQLRASTPSGQSTGCGGTFRGGGRQWCSRVLRWGIKEPLCASVSSSIKWDNDSFSGLTVCGKGCRLTLGYNNHRRNFSRILRFYSSRNLKGKFQVILDFWCVEQEAKI